MLGGEPLGVYPGPIRESEYAPAVRDPAPSGPREADVSKQETAKQAFERPQPLQVLQRDVKRQTELLQEHREIDADCLAPCRGAVA